MKKAISALVTVAAVCCLTVPQHATAGLRVPADDFPPAGGVWEMLVPLPLPTGTLGTAEIVSMDMVSTGLAHALPAPGNTTGGLVAMFDCSTEILTNEILYAGQTRPASASAQGSTFQVDSFFDVFFDITHSGASGDTRSFDIEMVSMNMRNADPSGDVRTRLSMNMPTPWPGQVQVTNIGSSGQDGVTVSAIGTGDFEIDSFFDVFVEVSLDGGDTWLVPGRATNPMPARLVLTPEPGTMALLAVGGLALLRRRRR